MINTTIHTLLTGGIVVVRTDTIYGIIARAADEAAVKKVYGVKKRQADKQCIVLIADASSVPAHAELIEHYSFTAAVPTSVVVPVSDEPLWITRHSDSVAYRVVSNDFLKQVIAKVGPVIAPSANPEGQLPAKNIKEAENYFGNKVDLYVDGGEVPENIHASRIIRINPDGTVEQLR
ncbi:MAG TPA: Sua5/YciO/YrdC/YwlC family protein [Candidatus Saccharibacteria bacterium]|nr:Sua5/YciO/YrdC/YwlC family protein [Candidatus Saccharibacteria bacterium]